MYRQYTLDDLLYTETLETVFALYDDGIEFERHKAQILVEQLAIGFFGKKKNEKITAEQREEIILKYGNEKQKEILLAKDKKCLEVP